MASPSSSPSGGWQEVEICAVGGRGLLLPFAGNYEQQWNNGFRIFFYLALLLWMFLGVFRQRGVAHTFLCLRYLL